jgi:hypothetical protein
MPAPVSDARPARRRLTRRLLVAVVPVSDYSASDLLRHVIDIDRATRMLRGPVCEQRAWLLA